MVVERPQFSDMARWSERGDGSLVGAWEEQNLQLRAEASVDAQGRIDQLDWNCKLTEPALWRCCVASSQRCVVR
jgi:hypothetical protein